MTLEFINYARTNDKRDLVFKTGIKKQTLNRFKCDPKLNLRKGDGKKFNKLLANQKEVLSSKRKCKKYNVFGQGKGFGRWAEYFVDKITETGI